MATAKRVLVCQHTLAQFFLGVFFTVDSIFTVEDRTVVTA